LKDIFSPKSLFLPFRKNIESLLEMLLDKLLEDIFHQNHYFYHFERT
jgi:hypothetical protein